MDKFDKLLADMRKEFGPDKVGLASEVPDMDIVSTGSVMLDFATGRGGLPKGTVIEIFGPESTGKTSLSYYMIAEEQKRGGGCAFINLEGRFSVEWARRLAGVNDKQLIVPHNVSPGTQAANMLEMLVKSGGVGLVVFDSIGAMLGDKEQKEGEKKQVGGQSALVTNMVNSILQPAWEQQCTVVFLNQVRDVFGSPVPTVESPGGHFLKHAASIRFQLKRMGGADRRIVADVKGQKNKEIGYWVSATVKKNKVAEPKSVVEFRFFTDDVEGFPGIGIDRNQEILDLSRRTGLIHQSGRWYTHPVFPLDKQGQNRIEGKDAVVEYLTTHPEAMEALRLDLMKELQLCP